MSIYEHPDVQYLRIVKDILDNGDERMDRTGVGTKAVFRRSMRFHMDDGFPALTTKRLAFRWVVGELLWMLNGDSDVNNLHLMGGINIWDGNAYADYWKDKARFPGDAGRNYGVQWRHWLRPDGREVDQLTEVVERIKTKPSDRRLIVSAWNAGEIEDTCLPACHAYFQFFVRQGELSVSMYQRSCDTFLGVPFNMAQYALILHLVAQMTGLKPGEFIHDLGDTHLYLNQLDQAKEQLGREPYPLPALWLNPELKSLKDIESKYQKILDGCRAGEKPSKLIDGVAQLLDYQHHPAIKAPMAV
jgi:thymidylate synthase